MERVKTISDYIDELYADAASFAPHRGELDAAPFLDRWMISSHLGLVGYVSGHPLLHGEGRFIHTSWLVSLDPGHAWAKTKNRYYRLGERSRWA